MNILITILILSLVLNSVDCKKRRKTFRPDLYGHPRPGPHPPLIGSDKHSAVFDLNNVRFPWRDIVNGRRYNQGPPGQRLVPSLSGDNSGQSFKPRPKQSHEISVPYSGEHIRLRGNSSALNGGRIEVFRGGRWGLVCDDEWDIQDASVACKQLGFKKGAISSPGQGYYGVPSENNDILMDNVKCKGSETNLQSCVYTTLHDCNEKEAASVVCKPNEGCEPGWVARDGSCYMFFGGARNLKQSIEKCALHGASLVNIDSEEENNFLSNTLKVTTDDHVWYTGGKRLKGDWKWYKLHVSSSIRNTQRGRRRTRVQSRSPRLAKAAMSFEKWFPGFGDERFSKEPQSNRRHYCLALTDIFRHPNGSNIQLDYFYWAAKICASRISNFDFICEKQGVPEPEECFHNENGSDYRGFVSVTDKGTLCLNWTDSNTINPETHPNKGLGEHNLCRNPDGDAKPWCWVNHRAFKFGYCPVQHCNHTHTEDTTESTAEVRNCPDDKYYCSKEKVCIEATWRCDGEQDCTYGEDELGCEYALNDFEPKRNSMIGGYDNRVDYINSTIEYCAKECVKIRDFVCRSFSYADGDGRCFLSDVNARSGRLLYSSRYDYYELETQTENCTGYYKCDNSKCISLNDVCNGEDNCNDFSDEEGCDGTPASIEIRLVDGEDEHSGRLEINYMGEWGTVCDDKWDIKDSNVVCRMLGYPGAERDTSDVDFGSGSGNILLSNVECFGNETSLKDCEKSPWRQHDCQPFEAVGVDCKVAKGCDDEQFLCDNLNCIKGTHVCDNENDCSDNSDEKNCETIIELVNGTKANEGRVEIIRNGIRGTVCDDEWHKEDADVVCNQLGYPRGGKAVNKAAFGEGTGIIWLDNVDCTGNENSIDDCTPDWGTHDCGHNEDAGVICLEGTIPELRVQLIGSRKPNEGRVEVILDGERGTICDDSWDDNDATVICRMLGFENGGRALVKSAYGNGADHLPILLDEVDCLGTEDSLYDCNTAALFEHDCDHTEDASVVCYLEPTKNITVNSASQCGNRPLEDTPTGSRFKRQAEFPRAHKIVGGDMAVHGMYPWQVGIRQIVSYYNDGDVLSQHWCGGTIISDTWILSAAHCFTRLRKNRIMVRVGDHHHKREDKQEQHFQVEELIIHENYERSTHDNDIALIKIKPNRVGKRIIFSDYVQPACLPSGEEIQAGLRCLISGWGDLGDGGYPDFLRAAVVPLIAKSTCYRAYGGDITRRMLCAGYIEGGVDTCQGDSGGPLVCKIDNKYTLVGVTSFGNGCAKPNAPGVYARVSSFIEWINRKMSRY